MGEERETVLLWEVKERNTFDWGFSKKAIEWWNQKRKNQTKKDGIKDQQNQLRSTSETIKKGIIVSGEKSSHWQRLKDFGYACL